MNIKKLMVVVLAIIMSMSLLAACGSSEEESAPAEDAKTEITLGVRSDLIDSANVIKPAIEAKGYTVEIVTFDDSILPNQALTEGSIDINWFQHEPYLASYNEANGTDIVMVEPKTYAPLFAMYSDKYTKVEELPDGAVIGVCNDASNQARGLKLLESQGLIKCDEAVEVPTIHDVVENPHNYTFQEAEMQVLPQSLPDVDAIVLAALHMKNAGLDPTSYLCTSADTNDYAVGFAVLPENADAQWAKDIAEAAQCQELADYLAEETKGALVPLWE